MWRLGVMVVRLKVGSITRMALSRAATFSVAQTVRG